MLKKTGLISAILIACFTIYFSNASIANNKADDQTLKYLELFGDVFDEIKRKYVDETDDKKLIEAAINGMLTSLDPHSMYLDEKAFKEFMVHVKGEFGGLGIEVTMENSLVKVMAAIDDTPAYKAGIKSGDYIIAIDDEPVMGMNLNDAVKLMRGAAGKKIHLTLIREGKNEPIEVDIVREVIKIKSVKSKFINNIAYFRVNHFSEQTTDALKSEIKKIIVDNGIDKIQGVILDLRDNPGGNLDQAISVTGCFLDEGEVVSVRGRDNLDVKRYNATKTAILKDTNMVVLINGGSASASEIVAGALQDHKRAVIMGTKSFGKASVQSLSEISSKGAIKLTIARYYTPSGKSIQAEGIIPDVEVEEAKIEFNNVKDNRRIFSESKLKGHLKKDGKKEELNSKELIEKINNGNNSDNDPKPSANDFYKNDFQLARAIDLLTGLKVLNDKKN